MPYKTKLKFRGPDQRPKPVPQVIYPVHCRSIGVQATGGGKYLLFTFFQSVGTDGSEVDSVEKRVLYPNSRLRLRNWIKTLVTM